MALLVSSVSLIAVTLFNIILIYTIGYGAIKWFTPLLCYASMCLLLVGLLYLLKRLKAISNELKQNLILLNVTLLLLFCFLEIIMRSSGLLLNYHEKRYGFFKSAYACDNPSWYYSWSPNETHNLQNAEFNYPRTTNSFGYSDTEPLVRTDSNEIRILTLGDSFTEGDGAPYDSSYPQLLNDILTSRYPQAKFKVINAGVCGSDPYYDYITLTHRMIAFKPDIIICTVGENDFTDIAFRGGAERFLANGTVTYRKPPFLESVEAVSFVSRLLIKIFFRKGYIPLYQANKTFNKEINGVVKLFGSFDSVAVNNNAQMAILIMPRVFEVRAGKYLYNFDKFKQAARSFPHTQVIDLLQHYKSLGIIGDKANKYYWKKDSHHNSEGYCIMAEGAYECIKSITVKLVRKRYAEGKNITK